jgi:hypothetical protein
MDLSVIIVNYNVRQFLENALASLTRAAAGMQVEIFVVDNASSDGSVEMVRAKFPGVTVMENSVNVGFARANNAAIRRAQGKYLLLVNPDTVVQEDTLRTMVEFFGSHPDAGLAGCKILNPDGTFQLPCRRSFPTPWVAFTKIFGLSALFPGSRLFGRYNLTYLDPDRTYQVDAVSGSFMMITRAAFERVGGLDESFFMYGEDLDWCYRVQESGFRVYYVHSTQIIHFKGESTKRSEIDEIKLFYEAMELFVEKHFRKSGIVRLFLHLGILVRAGAASLSRWARPLVQVGLDALLVDIALFLSAWMYLGNFLRFPMNANPVVWFVPALMVVATASFLGLYTVFKYSASRAAVAVIVSYVLLSAVVFFAKEFAYSRAVVILSGLLSILFIPGWRLVVRVRGKAALRQGERGSLYGRPTVIVGSGPSAQEVLRKLRARVDGGYEVLGFIAKQSTTIGEKISGVEVIGSMDNVGKVIKERGVTEVIFATDAVSYADMLSVIARSGSRAVNFRLVPRSLEAIIGKTRIDDLDTLPLVDIEYNLHKPGHRILKRLFDIVLSGILLVLCYVPVRVSGRRGAFARRVLLLPQVFAGRISLVGLPMEESEGPSLSDQRQGGWPTEIELGPKGLTGLVQINRRDDLTLEETERYAMYYAKNQSVVLDLEILSKAIALHLKKERRMRDGEGSS